MAKIPLAPGEVYSLLEPGPVVLLATRGERRANVMSMSWQTMLEFEPPLIGCVISSRNYSFGLLRSSKECSINIPTVEIAQKVVNCGNSSGRDLDKFREFQLTALPASIVNAPLVGECYANCECKVIDETLVNQYELFILEVVAAWIDPRQNNPRTLHHRGNGLFMVAGESIRIDSRMK